MAKRQTPLKGMEDEFAVPGPIQVSADQYAVALKAKGKSLAKFNTTKDALISAMKESGITKIRVQIDSGYKIIELEDEAKLKIRKPKDETHPEEND